MKICSKTLFLIGLSKTGIFPDIKRNSDIRLMQDLALTAPTLLFSTKFKRFQNKFLFVLTFLMLVIKFNACFIEQWQC